MSSALSAVLDDLMTDDFAGFEGGNTPIIAAGETIQVKANEWTVDREEIEINGAKHVFDVRYMFVNPRLSSIALRRTDASSMSGRIDFNATVVSERQLEFLIGGQWISLQTLCLKALRKANPGMEQRTDTDILQDLKNYGFDLGGNLPMYLQHLGADTEAFHSVAEKFVALGARENTEQVRAKGQRSVLVSSYRHDETVPLALLEVNKADRSRSATNTGFIGFADAAWNTFTQIVSIDAQRTALRKVIESHALDSDEAKAAAAKEAEIRQMFGTAQQVRPFRNWGGTSINKDVLSGDIRYYAQQVPCGRFAVKTADGSQTWSVWGTRAKSGQAQPQPSTPPVPETPENAAY